MTISEHRHQARRLRRARSTISEYRHPLSGGQKSEPQIFSEQARAVRNADVGTWLFSVPDALGVIIEQDGYEKTRSYWKYLKTKLKKEGSEVVSATNQLKLTAQNGKRRLTDTLDAQGMSALAKNIHNEKVPRSLDWLLYSEKP